MRVLKKLPVKSILEPLYPMKGTLRTVKIATPDKHGEEHLIGGKAEPLVAFNKPRMRLQCMALHMTDAMEAIAALIIRVLICPLFGTVLCEHLPPSSSLIAESKRASPLLLISPSAREVLRTSLR